MFRRKLFALLAALCVTLGSVVPAHADEIYNPWTDILDLTTVNNSGTNYFAFNKTTTINIDAGYESIVSYIDMVWYCGYGAPDSVHLWRSNNANQRLSLTIKRIGSSNFYRIYGNVAGYAMRNFKFDIVSNSAYSGTTAYRSYEVRSCRIAGTIATYNLNLSYNASPQPDASYTRNFVYEPVVDLEYGIPVPYTMEITPSDWALYDYLDIFIAAQGATIDSVAVHHNGRAIPFSTTEHGSSYAGQTTQDNYTGVILSDSYMMLHIDLTTIQHSSNVSPTIIITGFFNNGQYASIGWDSAIGYVRDAERGGVLHWFNQAKEFLTGLFNPDASGADDFQDNAQEQGNELGNLNDQLDAVTKPPVEDIVVDVGDFISPDQIQSVGAEFAAITNDGLTITMVSVALIVALVAYVLYGKR